MTCYYLRNATRYALTARSHFSQHKMDQALVLVEATSRPPAITHRPQSNPGAWLVLVAIFMSGMLCQACVPRLCHKGAQVGGKLMKQLKACWTWSKRKVTNEREGSPCKTRRRDGTSEHETPTTTERMSPRWLSMAEMRAPERRDPQTTESPSSSISGPDFNASSQRKESEAKRKRDNPSIGGQ